MYLTRRKIKDVEYATACNFEDGEFFLFDIREGFHGEGTMMVSFYEQSVLVYSIYSEKKQKSFFYIHKDLYTGNLSNSIKLRLSKLVYGADLFPYGNIDVNNVLNFVLHVPLGTGIDVECDDMEKQLKNDDRIMNDIKEGSCQPTTDYEIRMEEKMIKIIKGEVKLPTHRVSAQHLQHIKCQELEMLGVNEILERTKPLRKLIYNIMKADPTETFFVGIVVWVLLLSDNHKRLFAKSRILEWTYASEEDFFKKIKNNFTLRLKAVQNLVPLDLTPFFELEVLVNRGSGEVDWEKEKRNRIEPNLCNIAATDVYSISRELFNEIKNSGVKPKKWSWQEFWDDRWEWAPTGAFHSQYYEDQQFMSKNRSTRNKLNALCRMPDYKFDHFITRDKEMIAWPSTKYEWGKQRGIYGVDITNFIMTAYGMADCENILSGRFPIGKSATAENVKKTVKETLRNGVPFCFDFEDFNSQHSNQSMKAVLDAYMNVFKDKLEKEQIEAIVWARDAIDNTVIYEDTQLKKGYKTSGTLLSGWRLTTFMNTVLNYVYTNKAIGIGSELVSTHNGDDVLASINNLSELVSLLKGSKSLNVRYQRSKCYFSAIAEFLRVDHHNGTGSQYLSRAVSTFVHGATESSIPNDLRSNLEAIMTRRKELIERQADRATVDKLVRNQLSHIKKIWDVDDDVVYGIINTHTSTGGIATTITNATLSKTITMVLKQDEDITTEGDIEKYPGVKAYANKLMKFGIEKKYEKKIEKQLYATTQIGIGSTLTEYKISDTLQGNVGNNDYTSLKLNEISNNINEASSISVKNTSGYKENNNYRQHATNTNNLLWLRASQYGMFRKSYHGRKAVLAKTFGIPLININGKDSAISIRLKLEYDSHEAAKILL
uniref:RNA-directed RNA polymerase n=1 Tax=Uromyces fabae virus TaxID=3069272 RepID=A0AA51U974_9VIRU|nr:putative RNA-dependent RNA polymerase [Uromyces fabae virus]